MLTEKRRKPGVPPVSKEGRKFHRRGLRGQVVEVECRNTQMDSSEDPEKASVVSADCMPFLYKLLEAYCQSPVFNAENGALTYAIRS